MAKERLKFVLEWERRWNEGEGKVNLSELCREFGVSRPTGYFWVERYRRANHDPKVVVTKSSRPLRSPTKLPLEVEDVLVAMRKAQPTWGPKKLRAWLQHNEPRVVAPAPSTIGSILSRRGLISSRPKRQRATKANTQPFADVTGPNATWCVDFKGHFRTLDGHTCYPLTILDAFSRVCIRCEVLLEPDGRQVQRVFDSAFREFGLPAAIRSDNGPPFASVGAGGLTQLAVWWLRLGIRLERITPGKPQENGRQERFHRTLKEAMPRAESAVHQQRSYDVFRRIYNEVRPHEALGMKTPMTLYMASPRRYPRKLVCFDCPPWFEAVRVDKNGCIRWAKKSVFLTTALAHEDVQLRYDGQREVWDVVFGPLSIGELHEAPAGPRFKPSKGRMQDTRVL